MRHYYQGPAVLDSVYRENRSWLKDVCWEAVGALVFLVAFWGLVILAFCM